MDTATVTTQLEPADIRRFTSFFVGRLHRRLIFFFTVGMFVLTFLVNLSDNGDKTSTLPPAALAGKVIAAIVFALIYGFIFAVFLFLSTRWTTSRSFYGTTWPAAFLPNTYTIHDEGLFCQNEHSETLQYWKSIVRFTEVKDYFYLMLSKRRGYIFPKRCFPTLEAAAVFANQVRLHLETHAPEALKNSRR